MRSPCHVPVDDRRGDGAFMKHPRLTIPIKKELDFYFRDEYFSLEKNLIPGEAPHELPHQTRR
jgi:hypothetical protein